MKIIYILLICILFLSACNVQSPLYKDGKRIGDDNFEPLPGTLPAEDLAKQTVEQPVEEVVETVEEVVEEVAVVEEDNETVEEEIMLDVPFDILSTEKLEEEILETINEGRATDLKVLERLNKAAREPKGDAVDTLTYHNIFHLSAEEITVTTTATTVQEMRTELIEGLKGKGTSTEQYAGIGVVCEATNCNGTILTADLEEGKDFSSGTNTCHYENLYTLYTDIDETVTTEITGTGDQFAHYYIVAGQEEEDKCNNGEEFQFSQEWKSVMNFTGIINIGRGFGIMVENVKNNTAVSLQLDYGAIKN